MADMEAAITEDNEETSIEVKLPPTIIEATGPVVGKPVNELPYKLCPKEVKLTEGVAVIIWGWLLVMVTVANMILVKVVGSKEVILVLTLVTVWVVKVVSMDVALVTEV